MKYYHLLIDILCSISLRWRSFFDLSLKNHQRNFEAATEKVMKKKYFYTDYTRNDSIKTQSLIYEIQLT